MTHPTLPSVTAAEAFWRHEPDAFQRVLGSMAERSLIVAAALLLAGRRKHVLRDTLFVAGAIEAVVLWQVKRQLESPDVVRQVAVE